MGTLSPDGATVVASGELKQALEAQPSVDDATAMRSGAPLWLAQTFKSEEGFCREYKIAAAKGGSGYAGIACRGSDAQWRIAVHTEAKAGGGSDFKLLNQAESEAVEAAVDRLKQGDVFGREEELAAIATGWSSK
jgi:hypothetical protein